MTENDTRGRLSRRVPRSTRGVIITAAAALVIGAGIGAAVAVPDYATGQ